MKIIAGLGNPGIKYAFTRHNTGWLCIEHFANNNNFGEPSKKFDGELWRHGDLILLRPLTFMNASGICLRQVVNFYKTDLENVLIIYDDMALNFGKLRLRAQGSAGGHNGLKSIIAELGSMNIPRLRVGIDKKQGSMIDYVLSDFNDDERKLLPDILDNVESAVKIWLNNDIQRAMTLINA